MNVESQKMESRNLPPLDSNKDLEVSMHEKKQFETHDREDVAINDAKLISGKSSTGLIAMSVSSSSPGYVFTASDRAKLVKFIPGVVIINSFICRKTLEGQIIERLSNLSKSAVIK